MRYWYRTEIDPSARPMLLFLHGGGEIGGDDVEQTTKHGPWLNDVNAPVSERLRAYFRVAPHLTSPDEYWDTGKLRDLVHQIRRQHADVASDIMFVIGISRGGMGALDLVARHGRELAIRGAAVFCPQGIRSLTRAVATAPVYLFHGHGDAVVRLTHARRKAYENLQRTRTFRWRGMHRDWTLGEKQHNCWQTVIRHPDLYNWFSRLTSERGFGNSRNRWPDFAELAGPIPRKGSASSTPGVR